MSMAFLSGLLGGLLTTFPSARSVALVLLGMFPVWALVAFLVAHRPPRIFKPRWLQDEEAAAAPTKAAWGWFDVVIFVGTVGASAVTIAGIVLLVAYRG